ncbi:ferrous iron efflux protein F [compost metagenome]
MDRYNAASKASILSILVNLFLFVIKLAVAIVSKSQGLLADTINSGSDIFSSIITYIGNKLAKAPSDKEHPYGHGKIEYVFTLVISLFMIVLSFTILSNSINSILHKEVI